MKIPPEITYRNLQKTEVIDTLIHEKIAKLEHICNYINSCYIAVEKIHDRPRSGSPYRVRIDITVPPGHEIVAQSNPATGILYEPLEAVIREAFDAARQQLLKLTERQRKSVQAKSHEPAPENTALVTKLFREQGYGFLQSLDGEEIYFHCNSVLHDEFERLEIGTSVHFSSEMGEQGPQASTVRVFDKPGVRANKLQENVIELPLNQQE
jgi:cold shock CspA family protein/ribosome-associated translation inhibitor RaiA